MFWIRLTTIVLALLLPAWAMAQANPQDKAPHTEEDAPPSPFMSVSEASPGDNLVRQFLEERGWQMGQSPKNPGGGTLVVATEDIIMDPSSIEFSQARLQATEAAFLKAMGELVSQDSVHIGKTMADRFLQDDLPEQARDATTLQALGEALAGRLAEASLQTLNKVIEELGGDPSNLPQMTIAERKQMVLDEFVSETTWQAMGELSGIGVFGVIERTGGQGPRNNGQVSVVVVKSHRFNEFGRQLRTGKGAPGQALPVEAIQDRLAPQLEAGVPMLGYFGVQPVVDEQGRFGLLSFGMAAPALVRGSMDEFDISIEMEAARESAQMMADGWLAQFASMTVEGQKESTRRQLREKIRETRGDGRSHIYSHAGVGRMVNTVLSSQADARLQGVQTIGQWSATDPATGHPYLGYVKYWSPATAAQSRGETTEASSSPETTQGQSTPAQTRSTGAFGEW
ncbi:DUF6844 domain-containing protein [Ectothiorhodospira mobilis]|uniref:DUF6844 domain-containing protein n=1 Tax=Ectothiorhodospira mobilis TaxID=195064 RepID=UPI001EE963FB|nr:hypothetical protein [Ectothiorhodospira mobilis]MCG5535593.1 hypothetical protein [Ectothiorhodospira mobilis]